MNLLIVFFIVVVGSPTNGQWNQPNYPYQPITSNPSASVLGNSWTSNPVITSDTSSPQYTGGGSTWSTPGTDTSTDTSTGTSTGTGVPQERVSEETKYTTNGNAQNNGVVIETTKHVYDEGVTTSSPTETGSDQGNFVSSSQPHNEHSTPPPNQVNGKVNDVLLESEVKDFKKTILKEINEYRLMHGSAPAILDADLTKKAEEWAQKMATDKRESLNIDSPYGQLTFSSQNPVPNAAVAASRHWYNRVKNYAWDHPKISTKSMQFTQLIWAKSQMVGVGEAISNGVTYVAALFSPSGNLQNDIIQNIQPVLGSAAARKGPDSCPSGWHKYKKSCYRYFNNKVKWSEAVNLCDDEHSSLTSLESIEEETSVRSMLASDEGAEAWVGLSDRVNKDSRELIWVDGAAMKYSNWNTAQDDVTSGTKCATLSIATEGWMYKNCRESFGFICKKRLKDIMTYLVVLSYPEKLWTENLRSEASPRYMAMKKHLDNAIMNLYNDDDWFVDMLFDGFSPSYDDKVTAEFKLRFSPDGDAPSDPLDKLRTQLESSELINGEKLLLASVSLQNGDPDSCPSKCLNSSDSCRSSDCPIYCCRPFLPKQPSTIPPTTLNTVLKTAPVLKKPDIKKINNLEKKFQRKVLTNRNRPRISSPRRHRTNSKFYYNMINKYIKPLYKQLQEEMNNFQQNVYYPYIQQQQPNLQYHQMQQLPQTPQQQRQPNPPQLLHHQPALFPQHQGLQQQQQLYLKHVQQTQLPQHLQQAQPPLHLQQNIQHQLPQLQQQPLGQQSRQFQQNHLQPPQQFSSQHLQQPPPPHLFYHQLQQPQFQQLQQSQLQPPPQQHLQPPPQHLQYDQPPRMQLLPLQPEQSTQQQQQQPLYFQQFHHPGQQRILSHTTPNIPGNPPPQAFYPQKQLQQQLQRDQHISSNQGYPALLNSQQRNNQHQIVGNTAGRPSIPLQQPLTQQLQPQLHLLLQQQQQQNNQQQQLNQHRQLPQLLQQQTNEPQQLNQHLHGQQQLQQQHDSQQHLNPQQQLQNQQEEQQKQEQLRKRLFEYQNMESLKQSPFLPVEKHPQLLPLYPQHIQHQQTLPQQAGYKPLMYNIPSVLNQQQSSNLLSILPKLFLKASPAKKYIKKRRHGVHCPAPCPSFCAPSCLNGCCRQ